MTLLSRLLLVVPAVLLFVGLAVLGYGGIAAFFSNPALTALAAVTLALVVASLFTVANVSTGVREDRGNRWVLLAFTVIGLLGAWAPAYADRESIWIVGWPWVRWLGVALYALGGILRLWPVFVLGRRFSGLVAIQPGHQLVTTGLYGLIRNPSYLGLIVLMLGWGLAFRSWIGVLFAVLTIPVLVGRIRAEEALLGYEFGEAWAAYRARTWRLVPWVY